MSVHYKFKSNLDYDTVTFDGLHISVADLKKSIMQQKKIGKSSDFDLQITNAQTKEVYEDDESLIPKNTSVIVARVPVVSSNKKTWERSDLPLPVDDDELSGNINFDKVVKSADLVNANASEEDKVKAMISQSSQEYDPSKYVKSRSMIGPLPPTYTCFRCGKQGHWIKNCPTNNIDIKRSTGIPRSFMVPVDGPEHKGALLTSSGEYAVPLIDHVAYKEVKKEKPPFVNVPEPEAEPEAQIPEELLCMVCRDLLQDAVLIPCCGNSFCDECVRQVLLDSDNHECPLCHETGISPDTVIPNRFLRTAVLNFRNETGYTRVKRAPQIPFPQPSHMDSPQPSPDSTVENQAPPTDPVVEEAVEDTSVLPVATVPEPEPVESESNQPLESETQPPPDPVIQDEADENVEQSNEDQQPGTPLADEPPVHNVPELELNEHEQYSNHNQYDEENKFSYSHYYNENMDSDSRDEGHVSSSEINQISTIETITTTTRHNYKPCSDRPPHSFSQQRPGHHGHARDPDSTSLPPRRGGCSHTYRSKPQEWSKGSLTVLVECDYNRDRPDYHDRYDRRNRDRPANTGRFPQHSHNRYERPQDSRYNQSEYHAENRREYRDYSNNSELREDVSYEVRTNAGKPTHSHIPKYNSPPVPELPQNKLNVVPPPLPAQVLPRPHGMPPLSVASQPFPPQPPPPGSSPIDSSAQPPPPGVGPLPPPPSILADPPPTTYKPPSFEANEKKPEPPREAETMSYDDKIDKFTRELQRSRSRDRQQRSRSRSCSRDWSRSSSRYRSSKSWSSRSLSRTPSRSSRSRSHSSYFSRSRSRSRSYSLSRSRSRSKSRSYSRSRSLSRSRTRSRSRVRHRRDSRERVRSPIISIGHSSSLSPKLSRPQNHRSPFQVKHNYSSSPYKPSYPVQYGGGLQPPPVPAAPPPALPHNVTRPHPQQIHTVQPITHPPPVNHYSTNEYHPERPSMYGHTYDDQYHGYNSYQRPYVPLRYQPRNARFNKPPQEHPRHSEEIQLRIPGWIGNRRRNYKSGYQQQRESREQQQQRRENTKVVRVIHQEVKAPYVCEIKEEPSHKKTEDKSLNKHKKHHHHFHAIDKSLNKHKKHHHLPKDIRKQDSEEFLGSENRSETPVNLIKVEVLPDAVVADKTSIKTEAQQVQEKLKKHKYKKYKTTEQVERKKKPSKKEKSTSIGSSEPDSAPKVKAKKKKSKTKEAAEGLKKKSKSKHSKVVTVSSNEATEVHVSETAVTLDENVQTDCKVEAKEEDANEPNIADVEEKMEDGLKDNLPELETAKEELNESSGSKIVADADKDKELDPLNEEVNEAVENSAEEALLEGTDDVNAEDVDDTTLHVEPPAISKWEREEYDEEIVRPQRRVATIIHKEEKESLSSDIIQRAEKAILQKPLKTAIVTTHPAREKHSSKCDRKLTKHESSPEEKSLDRVPFADEYTQLKSAAGVDCGPDESPTLQVTICTDKDKRSVHAKKKSESRSSLKEENSNLKRLKLDRSKFLDKSSDSGASQSAQRTIVVAETSSKSSSKHGDWQRSFEDGEIKDAKYEKTKIIVSKRASDRGHPSFKERGSGHSMQKYSDPEFSYPKDVKRRKYETSDRDDKGVHDKTKFYSSHTLEDREHGKRHAFDREENQMSKIRSRSKEKKDVGLKPKHLGSGLSRSKSYDSAESFPNNPKYVVKKHRSKCSAQSNKYRSEESNSGRIAVHETIKARIENKIHDKKPDRIRSKDNRDDHRPSKRRDISHDESGFEPNYDGTSESDHSIKMGRSDVREKPQSKSSKRSSSNFPDNEAKRLKQDRPTSTASLNDQQRNKARHLSLVTTKDSVVSSGESSSYQSESDSSVSEDGRKASKNKSPESEHKHKHKKSKHKKHKKHKHKHKKKKSHKSKQKD